MKWYLVNPLDQEVRTQYHLKDGDPPTEIILPPERITEFDNETLFNHAREFLVAAVLNARNITHFDHEREKVREEIVTTL